MLGPPAPGRSGAGAGVAPLVALVAVGLGLTLGWGGVDVASAAHRVSEFRHHGFEIWDASWYGGQWTLNYSLIFAPVASALGLRLLALLGAAAAALAFERIVTAHFGPPARLAAVVFAAGTVVETSIGQLPFLSGEAAALMAMWAATRRQWPLAWVLASGAAALSPLAGAFLALGAFAWLASSRRSRPRPWCLGLVGIAVTVAVPVAVTTLLFRGEGAMPFSALDCVWDLVVAAVIFALAPRPEHVLRTGIGLYGAAIAVSFAVQSPVGNNVGRLGDCLALPLAAVLLWPRRRVLLIGLAIPLVLSGWGPAWGAMTSLPSQPAAQRAFYEPLDHWLARSDPGGTRGRVEVVPTEEHWEAVWVADVEPLARGWERQSDVGANPIFYRAGDLTPQSYRSWLLDNGVALVALPAAPLDFAARAEGSLVARGVPGLRPVWHDRHWRVWAVTGSTGLLSGPGSIIDVGSQRVVLNARRTGILTLRVAWDDNWIVSQGDACADAGGRWTRLDVARPGRVVVSVTLRSSVGRCHSRAGPLPA